MLQRVQTNLAAALVRAVRTAAQAALAAIGTGALVTSMDWQAVVSVAVSAAIISLLHGIAGGLPETADSRIGAK